MSRGDWRKLNRRALLAMFGAAGAIFGVPEAAQALLFSGAQVGGGGGTLLTTMTLLNTSGAVQAVGSCTQIFGHPFKKGQIASGDAPIFKTSGGTTIPYSVSVLKATWNDGSLKHAAFMLRLPVTIAGNGSLTVNIYSGGTYPSNSSRTTSDYSAGGLDLKVNVTGQDNLSGTWTSSLSQGVSVGNSDNYKYMDGDAGRVDRIRASFRQSSADHGQLEGYWYVAALNDASGALGGIRYMCRVCQPWYNVASPAPQYRSFTAFETANGASQIRDLFATMPAAKNFTWSGSGGSLTCTANGMQSGLACQLTTTGTLPAGFSTNQTYCTYRVDANTMAAGINFNSTVGNGTVITPTSFGTGTHTMTIYPMVSQFGSLNTSEANGRWSYIQGGGSVSADTTIVCQMNNRYWCATTILPPYDFNTYSPTSNSSYSYFPGTAAWVNRAIGSTGEREDIGPFNSPSIRHLFTQAPVDEQVVRVTGLVGSHLPVCLRDVSTRCIPVTNNGTYSGMPAANTNFRWDGGTGTFVSGFTPPSNTNVYTQGWADLDFSHMTPFTFYPYLLTGEPNMADQLAEYANAAHFGLYPGPDTAVVNGTTQTIGGVRISSINGTTRYGMFLSGDLLRTQAWIQREVASALIVVSPENTAYQTYFRDMLNDTHTGCLDYINMLVAGADPYVTNAGMWAEDQNGGGGVGSQWTKGYYINGVAFADTIGEMSNARTFANYLAKWPAYVCNTFGPWATCYYAATERNGPDSTSPYITTDALLGLQGFNCSWSSVTNVFTLASAPTQNSTGYSLKNGDMIRWNFGIEGPVAGGFNGADPYYVVNVTGGGVPGVATFQLSATKGGSPITITDTSSGSEIMYGMPQVVPNNGSVNSTIPDAYVANVSTAFNWLNARGGTVDATAMNAMMTLIHGISGYVASFNSDPKYATGTTYV